MEQNNLLELIRALSNANGAPGFEDDVVQVLREKTAGLDGADLQEDAMRNLYCRLKSTEGKPTVMLDAHTDEVGFMVRAIHPNGTLRFITMGGWVPCNIPAHRVRVRNALGEYVPGIITSKPPHFMTEAERQRVPDPLEMSIDIGARSAEEAVRDFHIRVGEPVVPDVELTYDEKHDLLMGKAFDCRLGCAALAETLRRSADKDLAVNVVGAFATQEEMGTRGATVTAQVAAPDVAIVFEGCPADDTFGEPYMMQTKLKCGPYLRHVDARMVTNPRFQRFALDLAAKRGIPVQDGVRTGGSTNGAPIHLSNGYVPTIVIGVPVRYIHTHYGIASVADVENSVRLACAVLEELNGDVIRGF